MHYLGFFSQARIRFSNDDSPGETTRNIGQAGCWLAGRVPESMRARTFSEREVPSLLRRAFTSWETPRNERPRFLRSFSATASVAHSDQISARIPRQSKVSPHPESTHRSRSRILGFRTEPPARTGRNGTKSPSAAEPARPRHEFRLSTLERALSFSPRVKHDE